MKVLIILSILLSFNSYSEEYCGDEVDGEELIDHNQGCWNREIIHKHFDDNYRYDEMDDWMSDYELELANTKWAKGELLRRRGKDK